MIQYKRCIVRGNWILICPSVYLIYILFGKSVLMMSNALEIQFANRISTLAPSAIREILKVTQDPTVISFAAGNPSAETFPAKEINTISSQILTQQAAGALQYGITEGYAPLREQMKARLQTKYGIGTDSDDLMIVTGGQQGLEMTAKILCNDGDTLACESPTFVGALNAFRSYGLNLCGIPMEEDGMDLIALEERAKSDPRLKLVYVIPTFQNPSGRTMSLEKRKKLLALAQKYGFMILEDSPYFELRYSGEDVPSIKSLDRTGHVIFVGSFSKIIAPGIRVGFVCADRAVISKLTVAKQVSDVHTNLFFQMVISAYLQQYDLDDHIARTCTLYRHKRDYMLAAIDRCFPKEIHVIRPDGGLFLWCELPQGLDGMELCRRASRRKVAAVPGSSFQVDEAAVCPGFRLNFSLPTEEQIDTGIAILAETATEYIRENRR